MEIVGGVHAFTVIGKLKVSNVTPSLTIKSKVNVPTFPAINIAFCPKIVWGPAAAPLKFQPKYTKVPEAFPAEKLMVSPLHTDVGIGFGLTTTAWEYTWEVSPSSTLKNTVKTRDILCIDFFSNWEAKLTPMPKKTKYLRPYNCLHLFEKGQNINIVRIIM
jgi:hypothetical protein